MKRKIYLATSTLFMSLPFITTFLISRYFESLWITFGIFLIISAFYFIIFMLSEILLSTMIKSNINGPLLGLIFPFNMKKAFHSELGEFYLKAKFSNNDAKILVYEQNYLYMIEKFEMTYDGDIDSFKNRLKIKLEDIYGRELREINKQKELKNKWKNWSGSVDRQSEREMKLNSILNSNP